MIVVGFFEVFDVVGVTVFVGVAKQIDALGVVVGVVNAIVLSVRVGVLTAGCKCPCMEGGDHAIGEVVVNVAMCAHIACSLGISSMGVCLAFVLFCKKFPSLFTGSARRGAPINKCNIVDQLPCRPSTKNE